MEDIILIFIFIISIITLPVIIISLIAYVDHRLTHNAWGNFAATEGLKLHHGNLLGLKDIKPSVKGAYRGLDFSLSLIDVCGDRKNIYTGIKMKLPAENDYTLTICPSYPYQRFVTGLFDSALMTRRFFYEETVTDDMDFDSSFILTGGPELIPMFTPELRKSLLSIRDMVNIKIDREEITYETKGVIRNVSFLNYITEIMYYMAREIGRINREKTFSSQEKELQVK